MNVVTKDIDRIFHSVFKTYEIASKSGLTLQELQRITFKNKIEKAISNLLISYFLKLELISPGSIEILFSSFNKDEQENLEYKRLCKSNLRNLLRTFTNKETLEVVHNSILLSGMTGKVVISKEKRDIENDVIELNNGSFFSDVIIPYTLKDNKIEISFSITIEDEGENNLIKDIEPKKSID